MGQLVGCRNEGGEGRMNVSMNTCPASCCFLLWVLGSLGGFSFFLSNRRHLTVSSLRTHSSEVRYSSASQLSLSLLVDDPGIPGVCSSLPAQANSDDNGSGG